MAGSKTVVSISRSDTVLPWIFCRALLPLHVRFHIWVHVLRLESGPDTCVFLIGGERKEIVRGKFFSIPLPDCSFGATPFAYHSAYSKRETAAKISRSRDIECLSNSTRCRSAILCIFWYIWGHWKFFDLEIFWWQDCIFHGSLLKSLFRDVVGCVGHFACFYYTWFKDEIFVLVWASRTPPEWKPQKRPKIELTWNPPMLSRGTCSVHYCPFFETVHMPWPCLGLGLFS